MITKTPKNPISTEEKRPVTLKKTGTPGSQVNRVETPDIDSDAHNRRAKELTRQVLQEPDVENEKVQRIKAAIENGTYEINAEAIAEKLLAEVDLMEVDNND